MACERLLESWDVQDAQPIDDSGFERAGTRLGAGVWVAAHPPRDNQLRREQPLRRRGVVPEHHRSADSGHRFYVGWAESRRIRRFVPRLPDRLSFDPGSLGPWLGRAVDVFDMSPINTITNQSLRIINSDPV